MNNIIHYPWLVFALSFITMWLSAWIGRSFLGRRYKLNEEMREDFNVILTATLTLLGLIIGFSFSMAISRYDQRKNLEPAAWGLMVAIAICCNLLVGYGSRGVTEEGAKLLLVLPFVASIAFMLIADIDTPRHGIIRVNPQNLISLAESLRGH